MTHVPMLGQRGQLLPRMNQRIAKHRVLHQPQAERQYESTAQTWRNLCVHDDQTATRHKLVPGAAQHRAMIRHSVVRKAEQHAVKRCGRRERCGIALHQLDIVPAIGIADLLRLAQHPGRNVDAVDPPGRPYCFAQISKAPAGAAAHIEHLIAGSQAKTIDRLPARILRQEENPVKKRNKSCKTVIPSADSITVAIDPLIHH